MGDAFLDADEIRAGTFVRHVEIHETLGSTNDRAAELARDGDIDIPALVVARCQTAGRGRGTNTWWSADGALTFSVLLEPAALGISTVNWPPLSLATAVAVCDALSSELNPKSEIRNPKSSTLGIKWPNDVMLDGRKVCGILIESPGGLAPAKNYLIVGIGMNVNNSWRSAPHNVGQSGTALCDATMRKHELQVVLVRVLHAIRDRMDQLAAGDPQLPAAWQRLCWLTGRAVAVQNNDKSIHGVCVGIDTDGALLVVNDSGTHRLHSGSVRVT